MLMPRKILIVEDGADVLDLLGEALTLLGWEAILAERTRKRWTNLKSKHRTSFS